MVSVLTSFFLGLFLILSGIFIIVHTTSSFLNNNISPDNFLRLCVIIIAFLLGIFIGMVFVKASINQGLYIRNDMYDELYKNFIEINLSAIGRIVNIEDENGRYVISYTYYDAYNSLKESSYFTKQKPSLNLDDEIYVLYNSSFSMIL